MSDYWGAGATMAGGILGAAVGYYAAKNQNKQAKKNYAEQVRMNNFNMSMQQENFDYQRALQQQMFMREDNATQRKAEDLKAAGMSPILAAGQGAGAGQVVDTPPVQGEAPQRDLSPFEMKMQYAQMLNAIGQSTAELAIKRAQKKYIDEQARGQKIANDREDTPEAKKARIDALINDAKTSGSQAAIRNIEAQYQQAVGMPTSQVTSAQRTVDSVLGADFKTKHPFWNKAAVLFITAGGTVAELIAKFK